MQFSLLTTCIQMLLLNQNDIWMLHFDAYTNYKNEQHLNAIFRYCIQMLYLDDASNTKTNIV